MVKVSVPGRPQLRTQILEYGPRGESYLCVVLWLAVIVLILCSRVFGTLDT
jgi:hypothetical protein